MASRSADEPSVPTTTTEAPERGSRRRQPLVGEVHRLPVVGQEQQVAHLPRGVAAGEQVGQGGVGLLGERHLLAAHQHQLGVQPGAGRRLAGQGGRWVRQ